MKRVIVALCLLAGSIFAQPLKYTANYGRTDYASQFHVYSSVLNTPTIEFSLFQGTNAYTPPAGYGVYFAYGKSDSDPSMKFVYGSLTNAKAIIQIASNDFPVQVDGWYAALVLTSSVQNLSVRGQISIRRSPEISSPGVLSKTYAVNGSEYGPFTGSFTQWPFVGKDADLGLLVTNAVIAQGVSAQPWSSFPATQNVRFVNGSGVTNLNHIVFNTSPSGTLHAGRIQWSPIRSSPQIQLNDNVIVDWGTDVIYARGVETNTINKGEVVYLSGAFSDNPTVKRAGNSSEALSARTIGIAAENIASNASGFVVTEGTIYNVNTTNFTAGANLYLGANGTFQTNLPTAPLHGVFIGTVERVGQNNGQIYVHIQNYQEIEELSDVNVRSVATNDFLLWNGTVWTNYSRTNLALQSSLAGYLPLTGGSMSGVIDMGGQTISNAVGISSLNREIDLDAGAFDGGVWSFAQQPTIPGYQTTTGSVNAANLTNTTVLGFATTARVASVEGYTNRAAGSVQRTGDVVNGSFTLDEVSTASLATNYPLILKHRAFDASAINTMIAATTGGLRRTTTGQGSATIWDSLNSSFATGTPIYSVSGLATGTPLYVEGSFNANSNRITLLEGYTNRAASALSSSVWASADSTTNYASRIQFVESSNSLNSRITVLEGSVATTGTVASLQTNIAARLASNVWASADSTTNYQSRLQFVSSSNSISDRIIAVSNLVRGSQYGSFTNDIVIGRGDVSGFTYYSKELQFIGQDQAQTRTASLRYRADNGIDYLYWDDGYGNETVLVSNNSVAVSIDGIITNNQTNVTLQGTFSGNGSGLSGLTASATNAVSSISLTGAVKDAVTLVGSGISQTNTTFNFNGYLVSTSAAAEYISKTGAVFAGNVDIDENNLINVDNIDGFGRRIAFDGGTFTGAWTFAQAPTIPSFVNTNNLSTIAGAGLGVISNRLIVTGNTAAVWSQTAANTDVNLNGYSIYSASEIRSVATPFAIPAVPSNLVLRTVSAGGGQGRVLLGAGTEFSGESNVVITATSSSNIVEIKGFTPIGGGFAGGNVEIKGGIGTGFGNGTVTISNGVYYGNAAGLTNFPSSLLTVSAGNTNYWRITTAPSTSTAAGSYGQAAISGTNMFFYNHLSNKWLRVNGTLEW